MNLLGTSEIQNLIDIYTDKGGQFFEIEEGTLGWGFCILYDYTGKLKTVIIKEVYINEWSSMHKVRIYKKCPKKYLKILEEFL